MTAAPGEAVKDQPQDDRMTEQMTRIEATLAEHGAILRGILDRLDKLNGKVAAQEARIITLEQVVAINAALRAEARANEARWRPVLLAAGKWVLLAASWLAIYHREDIARSVGAAPAVPHQHEVSK